MKYRTLVLGADLQPISLFPEPMTIPAEDAVTRVINGTCFVVEEYPVLIKTPTIKMNWPSIIARKEYLHLDRIAVFNLDTLYFRDHALCAFCEEPIPSARCATIDHMIPKSKGGTHSWENALLACPKCNHTKGDSLPTGRWKPKRLPFKPSFWQLLEARKQFPVTVWDDSWVPYLGTWNGEIRVH